MTSKQGALTRTNIYVDKLELIMPKDYSPAHPSGQLGGHRQDYGAARPSNPSADSHVLAGLPKLRGCDAFFSVIISASDEALLKRLGINVCCEPKFERSTYYHK